MFSQFFAACHTFTLFQSLPNMFGKRRRKITDLGKLSITFCNNPKNVPKLYRCMRASKIVKVQWFWEFQLYHLISSRRSRKRCSLRNEYLLAKIDADTTESVYLERRSLLIKYEIDAKHTRFQADTSRIVAQAARLRTIWGFRGTHERRRNKCSFVAINETQ